MLLFRFYGGTLESLTYPIGNWNLGGQEKSSIGGETLEHDSLKRWYHSRTAPSREESLSTIPPVVRHDASNVIVCESSKSEPKWLMLMTPRLSTWFAGFLRPGRAFFFPPSGAFPPAAAHPPTQVTKRATLNKIR